MAQQILVQTQNLADKVFGTDVASRRLGELVDQFTSLNVQNVDGFLQELERALKSGDPREESEDIFAQARFAMGLARTGYRVVMNPPNTTADLLFQNGDTEVYADVKRLRTQGQLDRELQEALLRGEAMEYGNERKGQAQVTTAISNKATQAVLGKPFVVLILSASNYAEPQEFKSAISLIEEASQNGGPTYPSVSAVLFTSSTGPLSTNSASVWENVHASTQLPENVLGQLRSLNIGIQ